MNDCRHGDCWFFGLDQGSLRAEGSRPCCVLWAFAYQLSEVEVRSYLLHLREERGVARGTYAPRHAGILFLYAHALDRNWSLFSKKEFDRPSGEDCPMFSPMSKRAQSLAA